MNNLFKKSKLNHIFVIAEAGSNWKSGNYDQDLKRAKKMIKIASKYGADAIKFQTYSPETVYVQNAGESDYLKKTGLKNDVYKIFQKHSMPYKMIEPLAKHCKKLKILFMSTPFSVEDAKAINKFIIFFKIASFELNHIRLLEYIGKTKKPVILSTGASTYDEIKFAINILKKNGTKKIALLHTISQYPADINSLNLKVIKELEKKFKLTVGLSDHTVEPTIAPLLSIGLGAKIIEKHFTLNKKFSGPDHSFALNPNELEQMISCIRISEKMLGQNIKKVFFNEKELQRFAKRSIQALTLINPGEKFIENHNFSILRPGNQIRGLEPRFLNQIKGKKSKRRILPGQGILSSDFM
jgi:N-acetylneuraminate synthase